MEINIYIKPIIRLLPIIKTKKKYFSIEWIFFNLEIKRK